MAHDTDSAALTEAKHCASQPQSPLLTLPRELRDEILGLAPMPEGTVLEPESHHVPRPIAKAWPVLADTCKQLRDESLQIFFAGAFSMKRNEPDWTLDLDSLMTWLNKLKNVSYSTKRRIRSVHVELYDSVIGMYESTHLLSGRVEYFPTCEPGLHFDACDRVLYAMSKSGLKAQQLTWPGFEVETESSGGGAHFARISRRDDEYHYIGRNLFNRYVLTPLLRKYDLYDVNCAPTDVVDQIVEGHWGFQIARHWQQLQRRELTWRGCQPEGWYGAWEAEKEKHSEADGVINDCEGDEAE